MIKRRWSIHLVPTSTPARKVAEIVERPREIKPNTFAHVLVRQVTIRK